MSTSCLEVIEDGCGKAYECAPEWDLQKSVLKDCKLYEKAHSCIFEGDSVNVSFQLDVDKRQSGQIIFSWPIKLINESKNTISGIKIGLKAYILDEEEKKFAEKFVGYESLKSSLSPGESYQYVLAGTINYNHSVRDKKLYLTTKDLISYNGKQISEYVDTKLDIDSGSNGRTNPVIVYDKDLCFQEEVCEEKTITLQTVLKCEDETFCNTAVLHELPRKHCKEDSCDHQGCRLGPKIKCSESSASVNIKCAKIKLSCDLDSNPCKEDWCLCQTSEQCKNDVSYVITAKRHNERSGDACIKACVSLEGCCPDYDKKFILELYKDEKLIDKVDFELGKEDKYHYKKKKIAIDNKHGKNSHFKILVKYKPQIYDLNTGKVTYQDCDEKTLCCKSICENGDSKACLNVCLALPHGARYNIKEVGPSHSKEELKDFLGGETLKLCEDTTLKYTLCFDKCAGSVSSIAKLLFGDIHGGSVVSTVRDFLGHTTEHNKQKRHKSDKEDDRRHKSDCSDDDCDDKTARKVEKRHVRRRTDDESDEEKDCHRDHKKRDCDDVCPKKKDCDDDSSDEESDCDRKHKKKDCDDDSSDEERDCHRDRKKKDCDSKRTKRRRRDCDEDECGKRKPKCHDDEDDCCDLRPVPDDCDVGADLDLPAEGGDHSVEYPTEDLRPEHRCEKNHRNESRKKKAASVAFQASNIVSPVGRKPSYFVEKRIVIPKIEY